MEKELDKNTLHIIFYFIEKLSGVLGKTHLQKMLFLSDLLAVKKFKEKLTTLEYQKYHYGPYSDLLNDYTADLVERGAIEEKSFPFSDGSEKTYTRYYKKAGTTKDKLIENLGAEKVILLDEVINSYGNLSLQEVLDIVYQLELVKEAQKNNPLDFAKGVEDISNEPNDDTGIF